MQHATLAQDFERVRKKQKTTFTQTKEQIDKLLQDINKCLLLLEASEQDASPLKPLGMLVESVKKSDPRKKITLEQKGYHKTLSAFTKSIDKMSNATDTQKNLPTDLCKAYRNIPFDSSLVNEVLVQHLHRAGRVQSAEIFEKEAAVTVSRDSKVLYHQLHSIRAAVQQRDLQPALGWAKEHRSDLEKYNSNVEFELHEMNYIHLLQKGQKEEAIQYARLHFPAFGHTKIMEIKRLMGCLAYFKRLDSSPYTDIFLPSRWEAIEQSFCRTYFLIHGLPQRSHLSTSVTVGARVLPKFIKLSEAMRLQGKSAEWENLTTIPVDLELSNAQQFHTLFVCPVTKETGTPSNPPMLLVCGHVISGLALQRLPTRAGGRFKCPYCPVEQRAVQARQIHF